MLVVSGACASLESGSEPDFVFTYARTRSGSDPELLQLGFFCFPASSTRMVALGPMPMICTITSSSFAPSQWIWFGWCTTKLPAGTGVVLLLSCTGPEPTHQVPLRTVM